LDFNPTMDDLDHLLDDDELDYEEDDDGRRDREKINEKQMIGRSESEDENDGARRRYGGREDGARGDRDDVRGHGRKQKRYSSEESEEERCSKQVAAVTTLEARGRPTGSVEAGMKASQLKSKALEKQLMQS
jgi:hypothetical protein